MDIASALKLCRNNLKMSQETLAEKSGYSYSYISHLEAGKRTPNISTLQRIAGALRLPLFMLLFIASDDDDLWGIDASTRMTLSDEVFAMLRKVKRAAEKERGQR